MQTGEGEVTQKAFQQEAFNILSWGINRKWRCYLSQGQGSLELSLSHMQPMLEMPATSRRQGKFLQLLLSSHLQGVCKRLLLAIQIRGLAGMAIKSNWPSTGIGGIEHTAPVTWFQCGTYPTALQFNCSPAHRLQMMTSTLRAAFIYFIAVALAHSRFSMSEIYAIK